MSATNGPPKGPPNVPAGAPPSVPPTSPAPAKPPQKKREVEIFAAPPPEPMSGSKKLAILGMVLFGIYLAYWGSTSFSAGRYKDRISTIPAEAYGGNAKFIAEMIQLEGKRRGLGIELKDVQVDVGPDSALGRMVTMDVRYRRFLLPSKKLQVKIRCPNPLLPTKWDGVRLTENPA